MEQIDRSRRDVHEVELLGQRLDDRTDPVQSAGKKPFPERCAGQIQPPGAQIGDGRQRRDFDLLFRESLDVP